MISDPKGSFEELLDFLSQELPRPFRVSRDRFWLTKVLSEGLIGFTCQINEDEGSPPLILDAYAYAKADSKLGSLACLVELCQSLIGSLLPDKKKSGSQSPASSKKEYLAQSRLIADLVITVFQADTQRLTCYFTDAFYSKEITQTRESQIASHRLNSFTFDLKPEAQITWRLRDDQAQILLSQNLNKARYFGHEVLSPRDNRELSQDILRLARVIEGQLTESGFESAELRSQLILEEALLNAWKHGNRSDPQKRIEINWLIEDEGLIEVRDEGEGFDYTRLANPLENENLLKTGGRGIFIIRSFTRSINWLNGGRCIKIILGKNAPKPEDKTKRLQSGLNLLKYWLATD